MTIPNIRLLAAAAWAIGSLATTARAEDQAELGEHIFKARCSICHSSEPGHNKTGPSLFHVIGRPAGSVPDFSYSDANRQSGIVWDLASLDRYLTAPQAMVPGTRMAFPGLKDDQQRAAVIAYLKTLDH